MDSVRPTQCVAVIAIIPLKGLTMPPRSKTGDVDARKTPTGGQLHIKRDLVEVEGTTKLNYKVISKGPVKLNEKKAEEYIALPIFRGEREAVESHVQHLKDEMQRGNFNELLVILSTAELDGVTYKINGQHTCWAVVFMQGIKPGFFINVTEVKYKVETAEELRMLYATYDRLLGRTDAHIVKIHVVDTPEVFGIKSRTVSRLVPGFKFWLFEQERERDRYSPEQIAALIKQHSTLYKQVGLCYENHDQAMIRRAAVVGAMFATFNKIPSKAVEFWKPVFDGLELSNKEDPRYKLRDLLLNSSVRAGSDKARLIDTESMYRCCISAWNKWRAGKLANTALRPTHERVAPK